MTRLLKAPATAGLVGPLHLVPASARPGDAAAATPVPLQADPLAEAKAEIARLERALATAGEDRARAEAAAREAGRREAASQAVSDNARRLAAIEKAAAGAAAAWSERLASLEPLAALVARAMLLKLVESDAAMDELVARSVARQMALVRRETIVAIRVSAADFPDDSALARFSETARTQGVLVRADPELGSGACRMELALGEIELGVGTRWNEAADLLLAIACEADAR